jgi:hypothetical protein
VTCRIQQVAAATWRFCPDDAPPAAARTQCVARATLVDDLVLGPPLVPVTVVSGRSEFAGENGPDGLVGAVGRPFPDLPAAQIVGTSISLALTAPGYTPLSLNGVLGPQPLYPARFRPLDFGTWRLARAAVMLGGQVTRIAGGVVVPVPGASVRVTAALPVPALAGAQPAPPTAVSFLALAATTDGIGNYRLGPLSRVVRLTLTASQGAATASSDVEPDYAQLLNLVDFVLP